MLNNEIQKVYEEEYEKINYWIESTAGEQTATAESTLWSILAEKRITKL